MWYWNICQKRIQRCFFRFRALYFIKQYNEMEILLKELSTLCCRYLESPNDPLAHTQMQTNLEVNITYIHKSLIFYLTHSFMYFQILTNKRGELEALLTSSHIPETLFEFLGSLANLLSTSNCSKHILRRILRLLDMCGM